MFTLSELSSLSERRTSYRLLKPWWEVFMEYVVVLMLMVSVLAGTLLLSRDGVVCLPADTGPSDTAPAPAGRRTQLDYQQYVYISQVCYHQALPWYSRFFPYVALLHSLVLLASGCFWFHFPRTSARLEHFVVILGKCSESPWTSRALSLTAQLDSGRGQVGDEEPTSQIPTPSTNLCHSGTSSALPPSPCPSNISHSSSTSTLSIGPSPCSAHNGPASRNCPHMAHLDRSDGEQARALFERVRRFRAHCEGSDIVYKVYMAQTVFKVLKIVLILSYTLPLLGSISFTHSCRPEVLALTGYTSFQCTHSLASLLRKFLLAYVGLVGLYGLLGIYTLTWICYRPLRRYSFQRVHELGSMQDVPDLCNDLAFLLHMADQYDPLLAQRLSVFLSPVSETRLLEENLERQWGASRLRAMTTVDGRGRSQLQLVALPRLPPALFSLSQLEVLKLELVTDARLTMQVSGMTALRELHLYHCSATLDPAALAVLQERLELLHVTFTHPSEVPTWVFSLRSLQELHLSGRLGGDSRGWALGSLRQLRHLRALVLRGGLQRIPGELGEVSGSLVRLEVHNEGTRLLALTGLRRLGAGLAELRLRGCRLERLPSALQALTGLRDLDLRHNLLCSLEELLGLQHLRRLARLRLAHNRLLALPSSVGILRSLELLDLSHNRLSSLPPALFTLRRLRHLLLANNLLQELPPEVGTLVLLIELDVSGNRLEALPPQLCSGCTELRSLSVAHNSLSALPPGLGTLTQLSRLDVRGNSLVSVPKELASCPGLQDGGLLVEDWLFHNLSSSPQCQPQEDLDCFPASLWSFHSALESRI